MKVMVIVKGTADSESGIMPDEKMLSDMMKFNEELSRAGIIIDGNGLQPSASGKRVRFSGNERTVIDGPFSDPGKLVAGYWIWKVKSMEEAVEWVKKCPNPMKGVSEMEIRPFLEAEEFGKAFTQELQERENRLRQKVQKIIPYLWFDNQAEEAVNLYTSIFKNSRTGTTARYDEAGAKASGRPEGSVMTMGFSLEGQDFVALNGGPYFKFSPAVSFFVNCATPGEVDGLWEKLSPGGSVMMELDKYPFSERYGWLKDRFGVSWQINSGPRAQKISVCLMFVGKQHGKAQEAMDFYTSLFNDSSILQIDRYVPGDADVEGTIKHSVFTLQRQEFMAMDSGLAHQFAFTPAISLFVNCGTQDEVDHFWNRFSEKGEIEQCGWLKDRYGVSWQIVPSVLGELLHDPDPVKSQNVMKAMLKMKKLDIASLRKAYGNAAGVTN